MQEAINQTELINLVQQGVQQASVTSSTPPHSSPDYTPPSCVPALEEISTTRSTVSANSVTSDLTMQIIQQQMQMLQKMMKMLQEKTPTTKTSRRRNPNLTKYCWTHGLCSHNGAECCTPAEGHNSTTTLQNRRGDSDKNIT